MSAELQATPDQAIDSASPAPEGTPGSSHSSGAIAHRLQALWRPAGIFIGSRVATLLAAAVAADLHPTFGLGGVLTRSWDSAWYLALAQHGYPAAVPEDAGLALQSTLGFFPLYPLAVRAVHALGLSYPAAGLTVSAAAGLAAAILLWLMVRRLSGPAVADRAVALFCFFPGALVLSLPYSEGLMLALSIGCLSALLRQRWILAGVLAGFATATRPNAAALVVACAWAAAMAVWRRRAWRALAAPALAPVGLIAFFAYLSRHTGEVAAYLRTQREGWDQTLEPASVFETMSDFLHRPFADTNVTLMVFGTLFAVVMLVLLVRSAPPGVVIVYTVAVIGMAFLTPTMGARPRFLLTAFPLVIVLADRLKPPAFSVVLATSAMLLGAFTVLTMTSLLATP